MMPRPSSQAQTRLTMLRVNQGFFGVISQSAKTSRGSRSGGSLTGFPSGKTAACGAVLVGGTAGALDALLHAWALASERVPEDDFLLPLAGGLVADLREEGRHARQLVGRPGLGPRAHERQGHGGGDAFRRPVLDGAVEVDRADAEIAAAGGEQLADELVIRLVLRDGRPDPAVIGLGRVGPEIDGELRLDPQDVAPFHRPVIGELVPLQQTVDQEPAFVLRVRVLDELPGLFRGGQRADHIQIGAPDKHRVGAEGGLDAQRGQLGQDKLVNLAFRGRSHRAFEDIGLRFRRCGAGDDRQQNNHRGQRDSHYDFAATLTRPGDASSFRPP